MNSFSAKLGRVNDKKKTIQALGATLGLLLFCLPLFSQLNLGRIFGGITDQSGGAIVGATVTVIDVARGISRPLISDSAGEYSAPSLTPGAYTVRAEAKGFQIVERTNIIVGVGQDIRVDLTLQPGSQTQTITVTEQLPVVNTTNAQLGGTVTGQTAVDLPLAGHQYLFLLNYNPGVLEVPGSGVNGFLSNGNRNQANVWNFDGLNDSNPFNANAPIIGSGVVGIDQGTILPVDAVQELNVIENPKAEYGWKSGAQVNVGLKSGTNEIHGTALGIFRNQAMDAKNPFLSPAQTKALDHLEQYGGTIGGPIKKDKLFFFGAYEGQNIDIGIPKIIAVPTTAAGLGATYSLPDAIAAMNAAGHPLDQLSLNLAGCTSAGACNAANGVFGNSTSNAGGNIPISFDDQGGSNSSIEKIDYHPNDHNAINGEYFFGQGNFYAAGAIVQPYWRVGYYMRVNVARGVWVWTPNSTWVNEMRFGMDRENFPGYVPECMGPNFQPPGPEPGPNYTTQFGLITGANYCGFPVVTINGFTNLGASTVFQTNVSTIIQGLDSVSYTRGKHLFKFGVNIMGTYWNGASLQTQMKGVVVFGTTAAFSGATPLETFLSGVPTLGTTTGTRIPAGNLTRNVVWDSYAGFVQDDWRVTRRLTANLGLRYELQSPITDRNNLLGNFVPSAPTGMVQAGIGGQGSALFSTDHRQFEPRLGLAWDVTGKGTTVVHAGGSVTYATLPSINYLSTPQGAFLNGMPTGFTLLAPNGSKIPSPGTIDAGTLLPSSISWQVNTPVFNTSPSGLVCGNGLGTVNPALPANAVTNPANPGACLIAGINPSLKNGYVSTWTLGVQHAFTNDLSVSISYVGNHGTHLSSDGDYNMPSLGAKNGTTGTTVTSEQVRRPYYSQFPYLGTIFVEGTANNSNYNGLQATLTQRVSKGLSFNVSYTLSHALTELDGEQSSLYMDALEPRLDYGNFVDDARHHFTITGSYLIPGVKAPGQLLEGWQLNTAVNLMTAFPYSATDTTDDISGTGELLDRWTMVGNPSSIQAAGSGTIPCFSAPTGKFASSCIDALPAACVAAAAAEPNGPGGTTGTAMLNSLGCYMEGGTVIVPPAQGTYGNMARDMLRGKAFHDWDLSLLKNWKFKERYTAQFRAEVFNVLNRTSYIAPTANPGAPTSFGQSAGTTNGSSPVIGSGGPREIQLGVKFIF